MRVLVCGGRDYTDNVNVYNTLDKLLNPNNEPLPPGNHVVIHGGARGADLLADEWAVTNWVSIKEYKADWARWGKYAGPIRNKQMLDEGKPDLVIAFPGGKGTANMIKQAKEYGIEVREIS
jgi:hypothetical protein